MLYAGFFVRRSKYTKPPGFPSTSDSLFEGNLLSFRGNSVIKVATHYACSVLSSHISLQCFDIVGWATGRASGL